MTRILVTVCMLTACCAGPATAQSTGGGDWDQTGVERCVIPAAVAPASVKSGSGVGIVDLGVVYPEYKRYRNFLAQFEREAEPYRRKRAELEKLIYDWTKALKNPNPTALTKEQREMGQRVIVDCKRKIEDLESDLRKTLFAKRDAEHEAEEKEIGDCIREYAVANGLDVVFTRGESPLPKLRVVSRRVASPYLWVFDWSRDDDEVEWTVADPAAEQKTMPDPKALRPAYVSNNADLSLRIVDMLNQRFLKSQDKALVPGVPAR